MFISKRNRITNYVHYFLDATNSTHRQYEALRAYFVEGLSSSEAAKRFGYSEGSFRVLCHDFRKNPQRQFFVVVSKGPHKAPKRDQVREKVIELRKGNLSIYDIHRILREEGITLSAVSITKILKEEAFARLPRRADDERPDELRAEKHHVADVRMLNLKPRSFHTRFGGLFLFLPYLSIVQLENIIEKAGLPESKMIPAPHAIRSLLALKLFGNSRYSHIMSYVFDEGLALFAGLNAIPKRSFLAEYSNRIDPRSYPRLMNRWFDKVGEIGLTRGVSFNLDFHTIPFYGEDELVEKHYMARLSHRHKGMLAFLAHDADKPVLCYANASASKQSQNDEILRFVDFWKKRTGKLPEELIFDSKLTTYENLNRLNHKGIRFITLRRRTDTILYELYQLPSSSWRRITLSNIARAYRNPRILDQKIKLDHYDGLIRQIAIRDFGHEEATLLLTNQLTRSASSLIDRYAKRMIIENAISDGIDFFHIDALSSSVAIKVDCDLQLTLMASSLYRLLGAQIGGHYETAKSRHIFRDFIDAIAIITISENEIIVRFQKRAHNPLLKAAGFADNPVRIPWLGNKLLIFHLG